MSLVQNQFNPIGGQSRVRRTGSGAGAIAVWSYFHATDDLAAIKASGYFDGVSGLLSAGDVIMFSDDGAAVDIVTIAAITAGVVTSQTADINSA